MGTSHLCRSGESKGLGIWLLCPRGRTPPNMYKDIISSNPHMDLLKHHSLGFEDTEIKKPRVANLLVVTRVNGTARSSDYPFHV